MPNNFDIPMLNPLVLNTVVEKMVAKQNLTLLNRFSKESSDSSNVQWDIIRGSRTVSAPNVPNAEAHIVPGLGRSQGSANAIYVRDKKTFSPTTMRWIRKAGDLSTRQRQEEAIQREVADLNNRVDLFVELCLWGMMKGSFALNYRDVVVPTIEYGMAASHKPTPSVGWSTATPAQIIADIRAWKRLVRRDGQVNANEAYATEETMATIFNAFANTSNAAAGAQTAMLMTENMKTSYYNTGTLPGFLGLNWNLVDTTFDPGNGTLSQFVPDGALFLGNYTENDPIKVYETPNADFDAPEGFTGKFMKTKFEFDPSSVTLLVEYGFLPVNQYVEQMVYVSAVG